MVFECKPFVRLTGRPEVHPYILGAGPEYIEIGCICGVVDDMLDLGIADPFLEFF